MHNYYSWGFYPVLQWHPISNSDIALLWIMDGEYPIGG
jgi:hypothetical protein